MRWQRGSSQGTIGGGTRRSPAGELKDSQIQHEESRPWGSAHLYSGLDFEDCIDQLFLWTFLQQFTASIISFMTQSLQLFVMISQGVS